MLMFSEKDPVERITYSMDFVRVLGGASITATSVQLSVYQGTDTSAASMLLAGSASTSTYVTQRIGLGEDGVTYRVLFTALTSAGDTLAGVAYLPVNQQ